MGTKTLVLLKKNLRREDVVNAVLNDSQEYYSFSITISISCAISFFAVGASNFLGKLVSKKYLLEIIITMETELLYQNLKQNILEKQIFSYSDSYVLIFTNSFKFSVA